jgi:hypothetical protein
MTSDQSRLKSAMFESFGDASHSLSVADAFGQPDKVLVAT